jgi:TM2 domain-containing membrane protein YozV
MLLNIEAVWLLPIFILVFCISYIWDRFFSLQGLPYQLLWAGASSGAITQAKAVRRSWFGLRDMIQDGYYKVGL